MNYPLFLSVLFKLQFSPLVFRKHILKYIYVGNSKSKLQIQVTTYVF